MTNLNGIYKCEICGNICQVVHTGAGELVCCGAPMKLLTENTTDAAVEKHVPVVSQENGIIKVVIGEVEHPMEEAHFIEWIELVTETQVYRQYLKPGNKPVATFQIKADKFYVREYCNLHGLWAKKD